MAQWGVKALLIGIAISNNIVINPITSLIQCHGLKVGQTANLLRIVLGIVFAITRSEPIILLRVE